MSRRQLPTLGQLPGPFSGAVVCDSTVAAQLVPDYAYYQSDRVGVELYSTTSDWCDPRSSLPWPDAPFPPSGAQPFVLPLPVSDDQFLAPGAAVIICAA